MRSILLIGLSLMLFTACEKAEQVQPKPFPVLFYPIEGQSSLYRAFVPSTDIVVTATNAWTGETWVIEFVCYDAGLDMYWHVVGPGTYCVESDCVTLE